MLGALILVFITVVILYTLNQYRRTNERFRRNGIKYHAGIPFFGNSFKGTFYKRHIVEDIDEIYRAFPDEKYVGYTETMSSVLLIRDPEIIRLTTVKHFDHFVDRRELFSEDTEPLISGSLFMMRGDKWRSMRTTLTPAFSSCKMKLMMPSLMKISANIVEYLRSHVNDDIDLDDLGYRYTIDVIAITAFGVQINSLEDRNNEFYVTGRNLFPFGLKQNMTLLLLILFPKIAKHFSIRAFPQEVLDFFWSLINETIEYREKNNIVRQDMLQLLMEASKECFKPQAVACDRDNNTNLLCLIYATIEGLKNNMFAGLGETTAGTLKTENEDFEAREETKPNVSKQWSRSEVMSQVFTFFVAGFETSSSAVTMMVHELALNPEIQEKLYQEIREHQEKYKELKFEDIPSLKYLECVYSESLRKWAPAVIMERQCAKPFVLPPPRPGAKPVELKPGDIIYNMVNSIHMDPKYYPKPQVFDPDRFRDDKKHVRPYTFMPFGVGPRSCIGIRFATLEVKVIIYHLVLNFKILKCPKTTDPIHLRPHNFKFKATGGSWVRLEAR